MLDGGHRGAVEEATLRLAFFEAGLMFGRVAIRFVPVALVAISFVFSVPSDADASSPKWRIYPISGSTPAVAMTVSEGRAWFVTGECCARTPAFESVSQKGVITPYYLAGMFPDQIASGGGWLFMNSHSLIDNLIAYSPVTQETIVYPGGGPSGDVVGSGQMAWAPTGDLWFLEKNHYARITHRGTIYEYSASPSGAMILGKDQKIWISLKAKEVLQVDPFTHKALTWTLPSPDDCKPATAVFSMANAADGSLFVACYSVIDSLQLTYLYRIVDGQKKITSYGPFTLRAFSIAGTPDGKIYIANGIPNALSYFDPKQGVLVYYYSPNHDGVGALAVGSLGRVWGVMGPTPAIMEFIP